MALASSIRRRRSVGSKLLAALAAMALVVVISQSLLFVQSTFPRARVLSKATPDVFSPIGSADPATVDEVGTQSSAGRFWTAAILSVVMLCSSVVAPQHAFAADPNENASKKQAPFIREVLADALARAQGKAEAAKKDAEEKAAAELQMKKLNEEREQQLEAELQATKKREAAREAAMQQLEKKAEAPTVDESVPKAQAAFRAFFFKAQKQDEAKEAAIKKEEAAIEKEKGVREKVLTQLSARRLAAQKAAQEAEEIAARIERLARDAREAAEEAKKLELKTD